MTNERWPWLFSNSAHLGGEGKGGYGGEGVVGDGGKGNGGLGEGGDDGLERVVQREKGKASVGQFDRA